MEKKDGTVIVAIWQSFVLTAATLPFQFGPVVLMFQFCGSGHRAEL